MKSGIATKSITSHGEFIPRDVLITCRSQRSSAEVIPSFRRISMSFAEARCHQSRLILAGSFCSVSYKAGSAVAVLPVKSFAMPTDCRLPVPYVAGKDRMVIRWLHRVTQRFQRKEWDRQASNQRHAKDFTGKYGDKQSPLYKILKQNDPAKISRDLMTRAQRMTSKFCGMRDDFSAGAAAAASDSTSRGNKFTWDVMGLVAIPTHSFGNLFGPG